MATKLRVLVTGGGGFVGRYLVNSLKSLPRLAGGDVVEAISIMDVVRDTAEGWGTGHTTSIGGIKVDHVEGSITDRRVLRDAIRELAGTSGFGADRKLAVFHLASIMSGQGEVDFDKCVSINLNGTKNVLECCRELHKATGETARLVMTSSIAAFGAQHEVTDGTKHVPQTTYGYTKACAEMMINDYSRKGWVDGRVGRLPTIVVRPGAPNRAATGCYSGVVRDVLKGQHVTLPVDPTWVHPVASITTAVQGLIALMEVDGQKLGADRAVNIPALGVTLKELLYHTQQMGNARDLPVGDANVEVDPEINNLIKAFPSIVHAPRAIALGLAHDRSVEELVGHYLDEFHPREESSALAN